MPADPSALEPVRRAALLANVHDLSRPPTFLSTAISIAARQSTENLRIVVFSHLFNAVPASNRYPDTDAWREDQGSGSLRPTQHWDEVQRLLTYVYVQATKVAQDAGRVLMDIDVLLRGTHTQIPDELLRDAQRTYCVEPSGSILTLLPDSIRACTDTVALEHDRHTHIAHHPHSPKPDPSLPPLFPVAALGGTFDHLHAGHKILLSMGAWIASEKLIVGITDDVLLKNKAYKEVLESLSVRIARVRAFLELFKPGLEYDIVPISDVYGPTAWDPNVQALVVSKETLPGASSIHKIRKEKSLPPLHTFVIDVISSTEASLDDQDAEALKKTKMSSTFIREWIVQNQTRTETI